jgi:hypothetical protein
VGGPDGDGDDEAAEEEEGTGGVTVADTGTTGADSFAP